jgi:CheY-like chemotaxis protein
MSPRPHVLVIDDDRTTREITGMALRRSGYTVTVAEDAMQGFMQARRREPDLILLDLRMPGGGGEQVWQRLKACNRTSHIPVVVVTGTPTGSGTGFLRQSQVTVLQKPVQMDDLVALVVASLAA